MIPQHPAQDSLAATSAAPYIVAGTATPGPALPLHAQSREAGRAPAGQHANVLYAAPLSTLLLLVMAGVAAVELIRYLLARRFRPCSKALEATTYLYCAKPGSSREARRRILESPAR